MARGVLLLIVGLGAGLAAGWALFGAKGATDRAQGRTSRDAAVGESSGSAPKGVAAGDVGGGDATAGDPARPGSAIRAPVSSASEEAIVRRLVREAYDERVKGEKAPEQDLLDATVRDILRRSAEYRDSYVRSAGGGLEFRERTRAEQGEIRASPLLLQLSVAFHGRARLAERASTAQPFRTDGPPAQGANFTYATPGIVPPGSMFLIERAVVRGVAGPRGRFTADLPESDRLEWKAPEGGGTIERELTGLVHLRHGYERTVGLSGHTISASLELHGRLVAEAEGEATPTRPLVMGHGWLTGEPVLIQVLADHGGGNPRTVSLDGKIDRIDSLEPESIWADEPRLRERQSSLAHYRGCGRIPAGKAFLVTRVEYRARLDAQEPKLSRLTIRIGGEEVAADATHGAVVAGAWTGDVVIRAGRERDLSLACHYFGLAEILIHGALVDDPTPKR